jgi:hypothetical protein
MERILLEGRLLPPGAMMPPFVTTTVAIALLLTGFAASLTPFPLGMPLIAFGLMLLVASNRRAARWVLAGRSRIVLLDRWVRLMEAHGGRRVRSVLRRTRPQRLPRRV